MNQLCIYAEQPEPLEVKTDPVTDWGFCYNAEPGVWVSTQLAWYISFLLSFISNEHVAEGRHMYTDTLTGSGGQHSMNLHI